MDAKGKCLCGAVSFTAHEVDPEIHVCHCSMCRRWSGPALSVEAGRVEFEGTEHIGRYASSAWAERGFCTRCGSSLFYRLVQADEYHMCSGAFDDPTPFRLVGEIFVDDKPDFYDFAGDHPRLTGAELLASKGLS